MTAKLFGFRCESWVIQVKGHRKTILKDNIDHVFNLVDKASRSVLRDEFKEKESLI